MRYLIAMAIGFLFQLVPVFAEGTGGHESAIPRALESYADAGFASLGEILSNRIMAEPFNLVASIIFLMAIIHTFLVSRFVSIAHHLDHIHQEKLKQAQIRHSIKYDGDTSEPVHFWAEIFHFLGEVEAIFGIWVLVLMGAIFYFFDWGTALHYISGKVNYTEPMFVVVIMTLASSRPILLFSEQMLSMVARIGRSTPMAWWFSILTIGPLIGSFITEPAAMTISALMLARQFYERKPSPTFAYATIGLLFVNVSVGGTLTHFAAPPVLMVAGKWGWGLSHMFMHFGWKAALGIVVSNLLYLALFRKEFSKLSHMGAVSSESKREMWDERKEPVPPWITIVHMIFIGWTVINAHYPAMFIGGFLFFLGFSQATVHHQNRVNLKPPLLVGFFLSGLVIHGGLQGWWIAPVLGSLGEVPLMVGATILTGFNDNAAITYLASLVPTFTDSLKYAVVAGAVTGGGLTVIANAPNPAGQSILNKYFENGVNPARLALAAIIPTIIMGLAFMAIP